MLIATACLFLPWLALVTPHDDPEPQFQRQVLDAHVAIGYGLAIGRVDADDKLDVILADQRQFVWYRGGDWKRFVLAENLTAHDNVCVAARDIDGDGLVEIAVGGQWNPGDTLRSGSVHYLVRPEDPTQRWHAVALPCDPTVHRMQWVKIGPQRFQLAVLPLHGRGNVDAQGESVRLLLYDVPGDPLRERFPFEALDTGLHVTHNFDLRHNLADPSEGLWIGGREGLFIVYWREGVRRSSPMGPMSPVEPDMDGYRGASEIRFGRVNVTIEPFHGNELVQYLPMPMGGPLRRHVLTTDLRQGHALVCADFLGTGGDQIAVGWREKNDAGEMGVRLYALSESTWKAYPIDLEDMACEDLKAADLDGDGDLDLVASGRSTHNLVVYWNKRLP